MDLLPMPGNSWIHLREPMLGGKGEGAPGGIQNAASQSIFGSHTYK